MAHTNASIQINQSTNWVKVQRLFSLSNRVPHSDIKQISLFRRGKHPKRRKFKFCLYIPEHVPYCMEPRSSQISIPCSSCQVLGQPVLLSGILKGRSSGQVVPAAARALPENPQSGPASHQLVPSTSLYCSLQDRP